MGKYKYSCRKCPIRNRCIAESDNSPNIKEMIQHAFTNRTDTLATWAVLQKSCLLLKAEEEREKRAAQESLLSKRLREIRETRKNELKPLPSKATQSPDSSKPATAPLAKSTPTTDQLKPSSSTPPAQTGSFTAKASVDKRDDSESRWSTTRFKPDTFDPTTDSVRPNVIGMSSVQDSPARRSPAEAGPVKPCWLTVKGSNRHIRLPVDGELVLGRFDPNLGIPPDIDLAFEDAGTRVISRRHAKIVGFEGRHTVEDLGSRYGVLLNGQSVNVGPSRTLQPGDLITLGNVKLSYDLAPVDRLNVPATSHSRHLLVITATGQKLFITPPNDVIIGRSDRYVNFTPDIDLKSVGELAVRVSRRHAIITWRNNLPYLEDLGSGFGTRLNGETLLIGQAKSLKPGDHIWLGGCVLAYDVEL